MQLSDRDKIILLNAARNSLLSLFNENTEENYEILSEQLKSKAGVFVTLRIGEELRGCIGFLSPQKNLYETVKAVARQSAINDPRFYPVTYKEIDNINIEISVLSSFIRINNYNDIILGKHGLLLDYEENHALLLPQVATENNLTLDAFLTAICEKAGLPPYLWQIKQLDLKVFEAIVFSEKDLKNYYENNKKT